MSKKQNNINKNIEIVERYFKHGQARLLNENDRV